MNGTNYEVTFRQYAQRNTKLSGYNLTCVSNFTKFLPYFKRNFKFSSPRGDLTSSFILYSVMLTNSWKDIEFMFVWYQIAILQNMLLTLNSMAYRTRRFNPAFTRAVQYSQSRSESSQFLVLIPISWRSILILFSHLRLGVLQRLFAVGLPVKFWEYL